LKITIFFAPSDGDNLLSEQNFGLHTPAVRAFKLVDGKVAARWMLLDNGELYRLAASRAGIVHKKVKRHSGVTVVTGNRNANLNFSIRIVSANDTSAASD
jgi:hypothetical protein